MFSGSACFLAASAAALCLNVLKVRIDLHHVGLIIGINGGVCPHVKANVQNILMAALPPKPTKDCSANLS